MKTKLMQLADAYAMRMVGSTLRDTNPQEARAALQAEVDRVSKDAERYQQIKKARSDVWGDVYPMMFLPDGDSPVDSDELDDILDTLMKGKA